MAGRGLLVQLSAELEDKAVCRRGDAAGGIVRKMGGQDKGAGIRMTLDEGLSGLGRLHRIVAEDRTHLGFRHLNGMVHKVAAENRFIAIGFKIETDHARRMPG